jgi:hypothetical protein
MPAITFASTGAGSFVPWTPDVDVRLTNAIFTPAAAAADCVISTNPTLTSAGLIAAGRPIRTDVAAFMRVQTTTGTSLQQAIDFLVEGGRTLFAYFSAASTIACVYYMPVVTELT